MAKYLNGTAYKVLAEAITDRDGYYCLACNYEYHQKRKPPAVKLQLDHANNDPATCPIAWVHWLCQAHNIKFRSLSVEDHISLMAKYSIENERERRRHSQTTTDLLRTTIYTDGSPEMKIGYKALKEWREFVDDVIRAQGYCSKEMAIRDGANIANDVNPQTTKRYYWKDTAIATGRYKEIEVDSELRIIFKPSAEIKLPPPNGRNGNGKSKLGSTLPLAEGKE